MTAPEEAKRELAKRWLADPSLDLDGGDLALLREFVARYPHDPELTSVDRRRLVRGFALLADRLPNPGP